MHRLLERIDEGASTIVPVAYLTGLLLGTMSYFAGVTLDAGLAVGVALALAAELHSFLEQRRCRALWAAYQRTSDDDARVRLGSQLRAHVAILAALVTFSAVNATAFAAETWHPAPGFLPGWLQIGIRGAVVPVLFLLTGALAPLTISAGDELAATSRHMLRKTIRATVRQWNQRIDRARKCGVDLAPVAVSLMLDAGDTDGARRVRLIADGLQAAETQDVGVTTRLQLSGTPVAVPVALASFDGAAAGETTETTSVHPPARAATTAPTQPVEPRADDDLRGSDVDPLLPPSGPNRPPRRRKVRTSQTGQRSAPAVLTLEPVPEWLRTPGRGRLPAGGSRTHRAAVRTPNAPSNASREDDARAAWLAGARTVTAMQQALGCSRATAAKHVRSLKAEFKAESSAGHELRSVEDMVEVVRDTPDRSWASAR